MTKKYTTDDFINKAKNTHYNKYDYSLTEYINIKTKVKIKCNTCNTLYEQLPSNHLTGRGCLQCRINSTKLTFENFIKKAILIHHNKYDYELVDFEKYINNKTQIIIKCNKCNEKFEQSVDNHLQGCGCLCNMYENLKIKYESDFYKNANIVHNNKYDYSLVEYKNANTKIKIKCNTCNNVFEQTPGNHVYGNGCPICKFSKGENKCMELLKNIAHIKKIIPQFKIDNCRNKLPLPFDFKVILNNDNYFLIEYQGRQHYDEKSWFSEKLEDIQKRDKIKYDYCKNNNIYLLVIKYTDFNNIEHIITNFIKKVI